MSRPSNVISPTAAPPLSKAARKRLAKLASKTSDTAAAGADSIHEEAKNVAEHVPTTETGVIPAVETETEKLAQTVDEAANGVVEGVVKLVNGVTNGVQETVVHAEELSKDSSRRELEQEDSSEREIEHEEKTRESVVEQANEESTELSAVANGVLEPLPSVPPPSMSKPTNRSQPQASTSSSTFHSTFAPTLPETLPTPKANGLPANRKRKTPQDFTPSGPGEAPTQSSPSKIGVKFEDGIAPGEGMVGETTMTPRKQVKVIAAETKKDRNMIERTIWTFIMIGGFISKHTATLISKMLK